MGTCTPLLKSGFRPRLKQHTGRLEDSLLQRVGREINEACEGRSGWARLPLLVYFAYVCTRHLCDPQEYRSVFDGINLGIHELGHFVFGSFGQFMTAAGGTIAQCSAPLLAAGVFLRQRDFFGMAVACMWLSTNFFEVAVYVADARALQLTLVAPGVGVLPAGDGGALHDWNFMLGPLGLLPHDQTFAFLFRTAAMITMGIGQLFGAWIVWKMIRCSTGNSR